jgi:hypothetical protein
MQALVIRRPEIGRVSPLCFYFMASLPTGPYTILFRVTCVFAGLHFEPCVPPCTFDSRGHRSERGIDIEFNVYWQRV